MPTYAGDGLIAELREKEKTPFHSTLLTKVKALVKLSRDRMKQRYDTWDRMAALCDGKVTPDDEDAKAQARKEPTKVIVPIPMAQVNTFISFCFGVFYQRERLFELVGRGAEDVDPARVGEALLDRDLVENRFPVILHQFLRDIARFGIGIIKTAWVTETAMERKLIPIPGTGLGEFRDVRVIRYEGNRITNVSPYRFFPDPRLPLSRLQEGEFVACEDEYSFIALKQLERDGELFGIDYVKPIRAVDISNRGNGGRFTQLERSDVEGPELTTLTGKGTCVLTEVQINLIPKTTLLSDGTPLGEEDYPVKYVIWYINDDRIVKCEPLGYAHGGFTFDVAEYTPDSHDLLNDGLVGGVEPLTEIISWLLNSHVTSVRKIIQNQLIVDPTMVEMSDIVKRSPVIRLSASASGRGGLADKAVKQLDVHDVTGSHIGDARALIEMIQIATGINDNALGQFHPGRRSATEARNVNASATSRLKIVASLIWHGALVPMATKMLANLRANLTQETFVRVIGEGSMVAQDPTVTQGFRKVTAESLQGNYDIEVYDGTLPSERAMHAQALSELVQVLISVPGAAAQLGFNVPELFREILILRGVKNPERFLLTFAQQKQMLLSQMTNANETQSTGTTGTSPVA